MTQESGTPVSQNGTKNNGDEGLIAALAAGCTQSEAADRVGVSRRTLYRRLADPTFRQRVVAAREELLQALIARLTAAAGGAIDDLAQLCRNGEHSERLEACRLMLTQFLTVRGQADVLGRLDGLERHLREKLP